MKKNENEVGTEKPDEKGNEESTPVENETSESETTTTEDASDEDFEDGELEALMAKILGDEDEEEDDE